MEPSAPAKPETLPEGCPAPLEWQEVVRDFYAQADAWFLDRPGYRIGGRMWGQGPPLYFVNGIGGTLDLFALLVYLLHDDFRCVLYDYPATPPAPSELPLDQFVGDLMAIADRCGDEHRTLDQFHGKHTLLGQARERCACGPRIVGPKWGHEIKVALNRVAEWHDFGLMAVGGAQAPRFDQRAAEKEDIADQVASRHPSWFERQTPDPFAADHAHCMRRAADRACKIIEQAADTDGDGRVKAVGVGCDPLVLR